MTYKNRLFRLLLFIVPFLGVIGCQKMNRPALGDYPEDHLATPTTELRFFANFDSTSEAAKQINIRFGDSISGYPSFFPDKSITYGPGPHGTAFVNSKEVGLQYLNANDFAAASSFSVAFWEKINGVPQSADGAQFVMSLPDKDYWHNSGMFLLFDHTGAGSTADSAAVTFAVKDNWFTYHDHDRIPHIYDKQWHHMAFVYDANTSKLATYVDGAALTGLSAAATQQGGLTGPLNFNVSSVSGLVLGGWNKSVGLAGPTDSWVRSFKGSLDQFRLYNKALSAAEVLALYNNKL
ncbi:MAG: hypothetical protein GC171_15520 [Terrimonas sp.]|nr:hypothetical protein [Terrimonas sp.]